MFHLNGHIIVFRPQTQKLQNSIKHSGSDLKPSVLKPVKKSIFTLESVPDLV